MKKKITFIGVGNLTQSLLYGFNAISHKNSINLYDIDSKKKKFANKTNITFNDNLHIAVKNADLIIIAVKPKNYRSVCISLNKMDLPNTTIISLMAGVRVKELSNHLNDYNNISRVMTNINAKYLQALSFVYFGSQVSSKSKSLIKDVFNCFGEVQILKSESSMDKVTALVGSGPAYFIHFAEEMSNIFSKLGFSKKESAKYMKQVFYGTALLCNKDSRSLKKIKESIASKGGTTESALKVLNREKFNVILNKTIHAAYKKSQTLSKDK